MGSTGERGRFVPASPALCRPAPVRIAVVAPSVEIGAQRVRQRAQIGHHYHVAGVLPLGGIPCAVLDDDNNTRMLTQTGFLEALGRAKPLRAAGTSASPACPLF